MTVTAEKTVGRGILAFMDTSEKDSDTSQLTYIDINHIKPNAHQPRKLFREDKIEELALSIGKHGIIQPILVRPVEGGYEIIAGERRWRAAKKSDVKQVPCLIKEVSAEQNLMFSVIENLQREDLNPIEEAEAFNQLILHFGLTQEEAADRVGKSRPYIANALRLLKLPEPVQDMVTRGELTGGHARTIAGVKDEKKQQELAHRIVKENLTVRETESIAVSENNAIQKPAKQVSPDVRLQNIQIANLEKELEEIFGSKVEISFFWGRGKIKIEYFDREELERITEILLNLKEEKLQETE